VGAPGLERRDVVDVDQPASIATVSCTRLPRLVLRDPEFHDSPDEIGRQRLTERELNRALSLFVGFELVL
jgi:hypothetical protein